MWFKKLFKGIKNNKMVAELQTLREELSKFKYYQWLKSERQGNRTAFKDVVIDGDEIYAEFEDGSRLNVSLLDEFMMRTNNEFELLEMDGPELQSIQPQNVATKASVRVSPIVPDSPISALLKKQKPNPVKVDITLELNIPPAELYKVICSSFENAEDEIAEYIVAGINIDSIKETIKEGLKKYYE